MQVFEIEVSAKHPVYVTELGCVALKDGERVLVIPAAAKTMLGGYAGALRKVGEHEKATLQHTIWEKVGASKPVAEPAPAPAAEELSSNRSMADKPKRFKGKA